MRKVGNTTAHKFEKFRLFPRLGPIRHDNDNSVHLIKIMIAIVR